MPSLLVTRTYLELRAPGELVPAREPAPGARVERVGGCAVSFWRYLYAEVGRAYRWTDRLSWTDDEVRAYLADPAVTLHVLYVDHAPAGYYELRRHDDESIEIAYFGLLGEYLGRGLGGWMLTRAVQDAWERGARRVWLHTCTLDHEAALPNYTRRGFQAYRTETYQVEVAYPVVTPRTAAPAIRPPE
jgi:GNAT superfamily N-acetyltransferase